MTDRDALLRAVAANPDDDTPRLVYADLMDELGGEVNAARARFIRLQIDLARDEGRGWFARADRLSEACRLAGRYAKAWLKELPPWAARSVAATRPRADDFPRGFLRTASVPAATLVNRWHELLDAAPVTHVACTLPPHIGGARLVLSPAFARLRGLTLAAERYGEVAACYLADSEFASRLEELDLSAARQSEHSLRRLAASRHLANLRVLLLGRVGVGPAAVVDLLASPNLPNLREIGLRGTPNASLWADDLRGLLHPKRILY